MAEIRNLNTINRTNPDQLTPNRIDELEKPRVQQGNTIIDGVEVPIGAPGESESLLRAKKNDQLMTDVIIGKDISQLESAEQVRSTGYVSATDKLLGLDLQPTMIGVLSSPPGNTELLHLMTPTMRRKIMRNLLGKQRERMKRLAGSLKQHRDNDDDDNQDRESFSSMLIEDYILTMDQLDRATDELGKMAKMLDVLDEMLVMQDYTISQMGTFSQG